MEKQDNAGNGMELEKDRPEISRPVLEITGVFQIGFWAGADVRTEYADARGHALMFSNSN